MSGPTIVMFQSSSSQASNNVYVPTIPNININTSTFLNSLNNGAPEGYLILAHQWNIPAWIAFIIVFLGLWALAYGAVYFFIAVVLNKEDLFEKMKRIIGLGTFSVALILTFQLSYWIYIFEYSTDLIILLIIAGIIVIVGSFFISIYRSGRYMVHSVASKEYGAAQNRYNAEKSMYEARQDMIRTKYDNKALEKLLKRHRIPGIWKTEEYKQFETILNQGINAYISVFSNLVRGTLRQKYQEILNINTNNLQNFDANKFVSEVKAIISDIRKERDGAQKFFDTSEIPFKSQNSSNSNSSYAHILQQKIVYGKTQINTFIVGANRYLSEIKKEFKAKTNSNALDNVRLLRSLK